MCEDSYLYKRTCEWQRPEMLVDAEGEVADPGVVCDCLLLGYI